MRELEVTPREAATTGRDTPERIARLAAARDPDTWAQLFEQHYSSIYRFVRYRLSSPEEAEDIAAQAFEVAYQRAGRFDYRGVPIEAWLIGIARNLLRDHLKKARRRGYHEAIDETMNSQQPDPRAGVELRQDIIAAMQSLTEDQQTVLSLRFLLDRSVAETARLMNRSEDAVKHLQRRALDAMNRALRGPAHEGPG